MKTYRNLYAQLTSCENLEKAFNNAKKGKSSSSYVIEFEKNLSENLLLLKQELESFTYKPKPLRRFIVRDQKIRTIHSSAFRDRIVHHALCNVIEPIFEKIFIFDSYANRKGKGALKAIQRFDFFKRKVSCNGKKKINAFDNNDVLGYVLKADIKHYFEEVNHEVLLKFLERKISDEKVMWLIRKIIDNYELRGRTAKGMPLGNSTSQFFANVYLNELDYFVKHKLKAKYYIRYVDDFVILHNNEETLEEYKEEINNFLETIKLELHSDKSKIIPLGKGISLLGYRVFYYYKLLRKSNLRKSKRKISEKINLVQNNNLAYHSLLGSIQGWFGYAMWADTYKLRKNVREEIDNMLNFNHP